MKRRRLLTVVGFAVAAILIGSITIGSIWNHRVDSMHAILRTDLIKAGNLTLTHVRKVVNYDTTLGGAYLEPDIYGVPVNAGTGFLNFFLYRELKDSLDHSFLGLKWESIYSQSSFRTLKVTAYVSASIQVNVFLWFNTSISSSITLPVDIKKVS